MKELIIILFILYINSLQHKVYIPVYHIDKKKVSLGIQTENINNKYYREDLLFYALKWALIEETPGVYTFPDLSSFKNNRLILGIKTTPDWAREYGSRVCSAPKKEYYNNYKNFIFKAIEKYNPIALEIGNEPNVIASNYPYLFGCIKKEEYVELLNYIYKEVKEVYPNIYILGGAFMYNNKDEEEYIKYVLENGIADSYSFHYYQWYQWENTLDEKLEFIKKYTDKPISITETSLLMEGETNPIFELTQSNYLVYIYNLLKDRNILFLLWYTGNYNGWRNSDLIAKNERLKPVYYIYIEITNK